MEAACDRTDEERSKGAKDGAGALARLQAAEGAAMTDAFRLTNPDEYRRAISG
ncbi:MAG: hypothetical protein WDO73_06765 [Ignavibacteriota bacterium]